MGGFATVLGVNDRHTGEDLAVKLPKARPEEPSLTRERFEAEVIFWLQLPAHPNLVRARFVEVVDGQPALFMEYVGGSPYGDLREYIAGEVKDLGRLDPEAIARVRADAIDIAHQIAVGMEFATVFPSIKTRARGSPIPSISSAQLRALSGRRLRPGVKHCRKVHRKGTRFGELRVLLDDGRIKKYGETMFALVLVKCSCGEIEYRIASTLRQAQKRGQISRCRKCKSKYQRERIMQCLAAEQAYHPPLWGPLAINIL
jgi:hypothetical protein